jgi:multiple sugar transport system substrate-binding protein
MNASKPITLEYWRVFDGQDAFSDILAQYKALHPYITINYRQLRYEEYEAELLNAFAEDRAPDIFSIPNTWVGKYQSKIVPMPVTTDMVYQVSSGTIKKEIVSQIQTHKSLTLKDLKNNFVDAVYNDVVIGGSIYGLPLYLDTMAMYYNRDLFNNSGLVNVPKYWNIEFQQDVKLLSKQDLNGNLIQSGIALGSSNNIDRFSDIISVLMMQNGTQMLNSDGTQVAFQLIPQGASQDISYNPGVAALRFYLDFSNPGKEVYSWNSSSTNAVEAFASGNLAMMLGYSYQLPIIKSKAPKLNFDVAPLPQIEGSNSPVNFANYFVEVVAKKSQHQNEAWDFVQFMTSADQAKTYLEKTKKPSALRSLVVTQREDSEIGIFADQALTARTWYKGYNALLIDSVFAEMISSAISNPEKIMDAINLAAQKISQTLIK